MSATAFNRHRRQQEAIEDAKARDPSAAEVTMRDLPLEEQARIREEVSRGTPPYADTGQLINIPADADVEREQKAMEQALANRDRVVTDEERWQLQNAHFRDIKAKAIPDNVEAGRDRTLEGQAELRRRASAPYEDPRSPQLDGRVRAAEPWDKRPDSDTTVSPETVQAPVPPSEDDDPATVGKIAEEAGRKTAEAEEKANAEMPVAATDDPAKAKAEGATAFVPAPDPADAPQGAGAGGEIVPAKDLPEDSPGDQPEDPPKPKSEGRSPGRSRKG